MHAVVQPKDNGPHSAVTVLDMLDLRERTASDVSIRTGAPRAAVGRVAAWIEATRLLAVRQLGSSFESAAMSSAVGSTLLTLRRGYGLLEVRVVTSTASCRPSRCLTPAPPRAPSSHGSLCAQESTRSAPRQRAMSSTLAAPR